MSDKAKRIKILDLLDGYSSLIGKDLSGLTNALCAVANKYPLDVVIEAAQRLSLTCQYPPTPKDVSDACELFQGILHPKVVQLHNGLIDMDFGHGRIDMRGLSTAEQDQIIKLGGRTPDGRNIALLSLDEKRASLQAEIEAPNRVVPRLRRMSE